MRSRTLDSVSVAELARQAQVSRTTFYAHFNNVYEVFQALIGDYMADVQSLDGRLSDMRPHAPRTYPDSNGVADGPGEARPSSPTRGSFRNFFGPIIRSTGNSSPNDLPARAFRDGRSRRSASSR